LSSFQLNKRRFQDKWTYAYFAVPQGLDKVMCLICKHVNAMLKDFNIKRHYDTNHKTYDKFTGEERTGKLEQLKRGNAAQQSVFTNLTKSGEAVTQASYVVAQEITRRSKPFSDGEFLRDCILKVADIVCPEQKAKLCDISLSNDTVTRRIEDLAKNLKEQLGQRMEGLGKGAFSIALDESTDISDTAQLLIFIQTVTENFEIGEELLSLESIKDRTRGVDICGAVCRSLEAYNVKLPSMVGVTTDGAPAMVGRKAGAVSLLSEKVANSGGEKLIKYHCIIHQEALAAQTLEMKHVLIVVKTDHFLKSRGLNHRQFKTFLEQSEADFGEVIYFSAVRWLSRGATLKRFFNLRKEIREFMESKGQGLTQLSDTKWLCDLALLVDVNTCLSDLNLKLQGHGKLIYTLFDNVKLKQGVLTHFPACKALVGETDTDGEEFEHRFSDFRNHEKSINLFQNPFSCVPAEEPAEMHFELIDLQESSEARAAYCDRNLIEFYKALSPATYPALLQHAIRMVSLFGSTYICEKTFSTMAINKSKLRSRLTDSHLHDVLRIATTAMEPDIRGIVANRKQHAFVFLPALNIYSSLGNTTNKYS
uniref:SPIN-DOC-like zinc-finger domain-containing protein n=1 Tax=Gadus morhua TaxID=8049 RepID=A0A8C5CPG7_GADMO